MYVCIVSYLLTAELLRRVVAGFYKKTICNRYSYPTNPCHQQPIKAIVEADTPPSEMESIKISLLSTRPQKIFEG